MLQIISGKKPNCLPWLYNMNLWEFGIFSCFKLMVDPQVLFVYYRHRKEKAFCIKTKVLFCNEPWRKCTYGDTTVHASNDQWQIHNHNHGLKFIYIVIHNLSLVYFFFFFLVKRLVGKYFILLFFFITLSTLKGLYSDTHARISVEVGQSCFPAPTPLLLDDHHYRIKQVTFACWCF